MKGQYEKIFLKKLQDCIINLNELDELVNTNSERQSNVDLELSDWYHLLQNESLFDKDSYANIAEKIGQLRRERLSLHKEHEIIKRFNELKTRLTSKDSRQFIVSEIYKTLKAWEEPYKNRIITDEQINEILNKKNILKDKRKKASDEEILTMHKQGLSQSQIAKKLSMAQGSISMRLKKIQESMHVR